MIMTAPAWSLTGLSIRQGGAAAASATSTVSPAEQVHAEQVHAELSSRAVGPATLAGRCHAGVVWGPADGDAGRRSGGRAPRTDSALRTPGPHPAGAGANASLRVACVRSGFELLYSCVTRRTRRARFTQPTP